MSRVAYVSHSDCGRHDTGWRHPEHVGRLRAIPRALRNDPELYHALEHVEGRHASIDTISLAHDRAYVDSVQRLSASGGGSIDADTVVSEGSWDAATAAVGCVVDAVDLALDDKVPRSFCAVRPPGHHALRDRGMGFCLFGNVAIGAYHALERGAGRVLILDWDVHHGNGTQSLVETESRIHFVSMHQSPWWPGSGEATDRGLHGTIWNVPMAGSLLPARYLEALRAATEDATRRFVPDLVLVSAGFDCLAGDPLGSFTLEPDDLASFTTWLVAQAATWCNGRVVMTLEGGYVPERVGAASVAVMRAMS